MLRKWLFAIAVLVMWAGPVQPASAQQVLGIAAVVNDEVISAYDLEERMDLVIASANLPRTQDTRRRLRPQVLRTLVDEELQKSAARSVGITISGAEIDNEIDAIAARNNMSPSVLLGQLERAGVDEHALRQQVLATLAWQRFMGARLLRTVEVSEEEIDEAVIQRSARRGAKSFLVSEILLPVNNPSEEIDVRNAATRLVRQIQEGARFDALARQFSSGATAQQGGDVGWVSAEQLGPEIAEILPTLPQGSISRPIRTATGFAILAVRNIRVEGQQDFARVEVNLSQILIPLGRSASPEDVQSATAAALSVRDSISACSDAADRATRIQGASAADLGKLRIGDLPDSFRSAIAILESGDVSPPIRTAAGIHLLIVCERSSPVNASVDRERVENEILGRKLNQRAQVFLRDLRRDAIVDYR